MICFFRISLTLLFHVLTGTGKTRTLVAGILEIIRTTDDCVLVSAGSNAACDEITERLVNGLRNGELLRIYAKSHSTSMVSDTIRPVSNQMGDAFQIPPLEYINKFRVVVCTLTIASCFARSHENHVFKSNHFGYVFIDEAASVSEPLTMTAIAGFCFYYMQNYTNN